MIVSIVSVDLWESTALRVRLADRGTENLADRVVAVYLWPSQLLDFDRFLGVIDDADSEAVSGAGIDRAALRESWESRLPEIQRLAKLAKKSPNAE